MSLEPGDLVGPYKIQALLGAGGMGEVYRARDTRLGREVALKIISPRLLGDSQHRERFEREARAASALNHPSVVTIYDVGESGGLSWIAMEWIEGRTLRSVLADGPLPVRDAWQITRQLAEALAAAHAKGIVHRDLKPDNVMLAHDGRAKILDFGLARQDLASTLEGAAPAAETVAAGFGMPTFAGTILGTVGYMSPEQAAGRPADFRADQFALGVLAYEMLAGRRAFERPTAVETLSAIIREDPVPLASVSRDVPEPLLRVIGRCLGKLPEERFASTRDIADALAFAASEVARLPAGPAPESTARILPQRQRISRVVRSRTARMAIVAVALLGVAVAAAVLWPRGGAPPKAIDSLAVLPFENAGNDPDADYLSAGLTDSLINLMSRVPSLRVMARGTVFRFRGAADPQEVGRKLGVGAVVTGVVSRRGPQLVISVELIETATGARLWGQRYDRTFADLLQVQDAIASDISDSLRLRLSNDDRRILARHGTENLEAYELYLKARFLMQRDTEGDDLEARRLFQRAAGLDPRYVDARLGIAATYARSAGNGYAPPSAAWSHVKEELRRVLDLDPGNVPARATLAGVKYQFDWDWAGAERDVAEIVSDPRLLLGPQFHPIAMFMWARGRPAEAAALTERALRVDPENRESKLMLADFLLRAGRLDEAIRHYEALAAAEPADSSPVFGLAEAFLERGDVPRAVAMLKKAYELSEEEDGARALENAHTKEDYARAEAIVARGQIQHLEALARERYISPLDLARLFARIGERDKTFKYLDLALVERSPGLAHLKVDAAWNAVRDDPRLAEAIKRVGIP